MSLTFHQTKMFVSLAWLYRVLLYIAVPYILWLRGLTLPQLLAVMLIVYYVDTVAEALGWYIYREDEYSPLPGAYALYMVTSVFVLLALLLSPTIEMVYLPIVAFLGALALVGRHGVHNRIFRLSPALGGAVLMLAAASIFLIPLTAAIATIVTPLLLAYSLCRREYIVGRSIIVARLVTASLIASLLVFLALTNSKTLSTFMLHVASITYSVDLRHVPLIFLTMLMIAFFEEFIGRAFIPYVGAGLSTYVFSTLHIPKLTLAFTLLTQHINMFYSTLMAMSSGLCIAIISTILVSTWRRGGLLASVIAHALYNTTLLMIAGGQQIPAIILTTILGITQYILNKKET